MLFSAGMISPDLPTDLRRVCLDSMRHEFSPAQQIEALQLVKLENGMDYPEINKLCRVIDSDTRLVLIDRGLLKPIRDGVKLPSADLISRSVQMYGNKIADFGFEPVLEWSQELYVLPEGWTYDPDCFGYMAGWFEQQKSAIASGFLV